MKQYIQLTFLTFTIWLLAAFINGLLCGTILAIINSRFTEIAGCAILIFFVSLFFSIPGSFIFWIMLLAKFAGHVRERNLFRAGLSIGFILALITAIFGFNMFASEFSNHSYLLAACIIFSAEASIMLHFKYFKKIK